MSLFLWIPDTTLRKEMTEHVSKRRPTDSGVDLLCPYHKFSNLSEKPLALEIRTGIVAAALTSDRKPAPYLLLARSSTSLTPLRMSNQIGLADAGYRGELIARVDYLEDDDGYEILHGRRLFQICQHNFLPFDKVVVVDSQFDLPNPIDDRQGGGFGSTGQ